MKIQRRNCFTNVDTGEEIILPNNTDFIKFGRKKNNDWVIEDKSVSGNHGKLNSYNFGSVWSIVDLDSTNGTYLIFKNGTKMKLDSRGEYILHEGELLVIGGAGPYEYSTKRIQSEIEVGETGGVGLEKSLGSNLPETALE